MSETGEPIETGKLAVLEERVAQCKVPAELLALATEIDELGRRLALSIAQHAANPELAAPLRPVLVRIPGAYTRALLRAAEQYDDIGSPRRAAFALVEALRKAFDANMVDVVGDALIFVLDANEQATAATRMRAIINAQAGSQLSRREQRQQYLAAIDEVREAIDWPALDDEPNTD